MGRPAVRRLGTKSFDADCGLLPLTLLDLLEAQRTTEDVHLAYLQALADLANATVKLQLSAGGKAAL